MAISQAYLLDRAKTNWWVPISFFLRSRATENRKYEGTISNDDPVVDAKRLVMIVCSRMGFSLGSVSL